MSHDKPFGILEHAGGELRAAQFVDGAAADQGHGGAIGLGHFAVPRATEHRKARLLEQPAAFRAALLELAAQARHALGLGLDGVQPRGGAVQIADRRGKPLLKLLDLGSRLAEPALGFGEPGREPPAIGVCRLLDLIEAHAPLTQFGVELPRLFLSGGERLQQSIALARERGIARLQFPLLLLVIRSRLLELGIEACLLFARVRSQALGLLLKGSLGIDRCCTCLGNHSFQRLTRLGFPCQARLEVGLDG